MRNIVINPIIRKYIVIGYSTLIGFFLSILIFGLNRGIVIFVLLLLVLFGIIILFPSKIKRIFRQFFSRINVTQNYYEILVIMTFSLGLMLRLYDLDALFPCTDEYYHLIGAMRLNESGSIDYTRAYFLTYSISFLFDFFGESLFIARIPGAIFGALTILPLYLLAKRISEPVGVIAAVLWATSPWAIGVARIIREYAFFPFFFLIILLILIYLTDNFIKYGNKKHTFSVIDIGLMLFTGFVFFYAIYLDPKSTFKYIFLLIPPVFFYFLYRTFEISNVILRKKVQFIFIFFFTILIIIGLSWSPFLSLIPSFEEYWINIILKNGWDLYLSTSVIKSFFYLLFLATGFICLGLRKKKPEYLLVFLIIIFELYIFSFHWDRGYVRPRYLFYILPFFLIAVSAGIFSLYGLILKTVVHQPMRYISIILFLCVILAVFNPINTMIAITWKKHGTIPMTDEYHDDLSRLSNNFSALINQNDTIITSMSGALIWAFHLPPTKEFYFYDYHSKSRFDDAAEVIRSHRSGWIIIDYRRNKVFAPGFPENDFIINNTTVQYSGQTDSWFIYSWGVD